MKRFDPKNKYFGWGITAFGVIACSILFFMLLQHGKSISGAIGTLISILSPIIWGMVITYLLWPLVKMFQRKLFEPLLQKIRPKKPVSKSLARGLSVVLAILVALVLIAALVWLIIPQDVYKRQHSSSAVSSREIHCFMLSAPFVAFPYQPMPRRGGKAVRVPTICTAFCTLRCSERVKMRRFLSQMCEKLSITRLTLRVHDSKI